MQRLLHLSPVHFLLDAPPHVFFVASCFVLLHVHRDNLIPAFLLGVQARLHVQLIVLGHIGDSFATCLLILQMPDLFIFGLIT